jgi:hypothetical protein
MKHDALAKALAIAGTALLLLPIAVPLLLSLSTIGSPAGYRVDYLMPFETYPAALLGVILVALASLRTHLHRRAMWIAMGVMFGAFVLMGVSAKLTGIADSPEQLEAWRYVLTATLGAISLAGQIGLAAVGGWITRDLFVHGETAPPLTPAGA